jgi:predicted membrane chloride channel (bestrophin family)
MRAFWNLAKVIDLRSLVISALAVLSTWICLEYRIIADFPLTLIATAIVFPLVFSIGASYKRREKALEEYGAIKSHGRALYLAARDWPPEPSADRDKAIEAILGDLLHSCRDMLARPIAQMAEHEVRIYGAFSQLSRFVERLRREGVPATEISRANQYLGRIMLAFENIKHIYRYRTPRTLRTFSDFFILVLPILYGPYFAHQAGEYGRSLAYVMPVLFALILVGLANIQDHLENPFDQIGEDDVAINAEKFVATLSADGGKAS